MSIFIDTGIFIGYVNKDDGAFISNAVFDEKLCHSQPFLKVSDLKL